MDFTDEVLCKKSIQIRRFVGLKIEDYKHYGTFQELVERYLTMNNCFTLKHDKNHHGVNTNVLDIVQQTFGKKFWFPPAMNWRSILKPNQMNLKKPSPQNR